MKKVIALMVLIVAALVSNAQTFSPTFHTTLTKPTVISISGGAPLDATSMFYDAANFIYRDYRSTSEILTYLNSTKWRSGKHTLFLHEGGTLNGNGTYTGGTTVEYWFRNCVADSCLVVKDGVDTSIFVLRTTQSPTSTLTGGSTLEFMAAGADISYTSNWSAGRLAATTNSQATANISSIVVDGVSQSFSNPAPGASVSGTKSVAVPRNISKTVSIVVTSSDGKTSTSSTSWPAVARRYYGWVNDTTGLRTGSDAVIHALTSELSSSKSKTFNTGSPTGTQFFVYAYIGTAGSLTQFDMNGFNSLAAITSVTRALTTANGYVGSYTINWTTNGQTSSSSIIAN